MHTVTKRNLLLALCLGAATTLSAPMMTTAHAGPRAQAMPDTMKTQTLRPDVEVVRADKSVDVARRGHGVMNAHQVRRTLRHRGYRQINVIGQTRRHYIAYAIGRRGPVKLVVDARNGQVVQRERLGHRRPGGFHGRGNDGLSFSFRFGL